MLKCTGFGIRPAEWTQAKALGPTAWIQRQLGYEGIDDSEVESRIAANLPTVAMSPEQLDAQLRSGAQEPARVALELKAATLYRAVYSPRRLYEMLVDFWSNHFNVPHEDAQLRALKTADDRDVIRPHALGRFPDLLSASAHSPAMLAYLDNDTNTRDGPNENYARELMELHTLGVEGGYTEEDVREVARCFTGWGISRAPVRGLFRFDPRRHDDRAKTVLGVPIPARGGIDDGARVLDLLAHHPATATHVATKLCRRFVADAPPQALVERVAARFAGSGGDIRATLEELLASPEFLDAFDTKLKRPMEYLTSALAALDATLDERGMRALIEGLRLLGQSPFDWTPPTGYPDLASAWTSTSALIGRWNEGLILGSGRKSGIRVDLSALAARTRDAEELADLLIDGLLHAPMAPADRQVLVDYLAAGGTRFRARAPGAAGLIVASPYFQYR